MLYVNSLDTYRFIAFFIVFIAHTTLFLNIGLNKLHTGDLGVSMFFVLSGFLITTILWSEFKKTGQVDLKNFYRKRMRRILPLYFIIVFIGIILIPLIFTKEVFQYPFTNLNHNSIWQYLTFTFNFFNENHFVRNTLITSMLWSICVEEQFYLVWPFVLKFLKRIDYLAYFLGGLFLVSLAFRFYFYNVSATIEYNTISVMNDLIIGCALSFFYFYKKEVIERFITVPGGVISVVAFLGLAYFRSAYLIGNQIWVTIEPVLFALIFAYFLMSFIKFKDWKILNIPQVLYMGKVSYGLYIYHILSFFIAIQLVNFLDRYTPMSRYFEFFLAIPILLIIAHVSYVYFEKRIMVRSKKREVSFDAANVTLTEVKINN